MLCGVGWAVLGTWLSHAGPWPQAVIPECFDNLIQTVAMPSDLSPGQPLGHLN